MLEQNDDGIAVLSMHQMRTDLIMLARQEKLMDEDLERLMRGQPWVIFGYGRLLDYLLKELNLPVERAYDWAAKACNLGVEDPMLYGVTPEMIRTQCENIAGRTN